MLANQFELPFNKYRYSHFKPIPKAEQLIIDRARKEEQDRHKENFRQKIVAHEDDLLNNMLQQRYPGYFDVNGNGLFFDEYHRFKGSIRFQREVEKTISDCLAVIKEDVWVKAAYAKLESDSQKANLFGQ